MSVSVLYMSMSPDGYIAGPNDGPNNPGGDGFMRLHGWYGFVGTPPNTKGTNWVYTSWTKLTQQARYWRAAVQWNRLITGAVTIMASPSSCPAICHLALR